MEMTIAWLRRKQFEAKLQVTALLETQAHLQEAMVNMFAEGKGTITSAPQSPSENAFDLFGVEETNPNS